MTRRTFGQIVASVAAGLVAGATSFLTRQRRAPSDWDNDPAGVLSDVMAAKDRALKETGYPPRHRMWKIGPGDDWPVGFRDGDSLDVLQGASAVIPAGVTVGTVIVAGRLGTQWDCGRPSKVETLLLGPGHSIARPESPWRIGA